MNDLTKRSERAPKRSHRIVGVAAAAGMLVPLLGAASAVASVSSTTTTPVRYETGNLLVHKSGAWVKRNATGASQGSALVTDGKKRQTLTLGFSGTSVSLRYCSGPLNGFFSIYTDHKLIGTINSYQPFTSCGKTVFVSGLGSAAPHTLAIQASAKRGSRQGASNVAIDYFTVS